MENKKIKKGKKILIVEDEAFQIKILGDIFTAEGFDVLKASDGEEGLNVALREHPDLILLDILLPKIDGITMLKELRKNSWGKNIPVVILTNLVEAEKAKEALEEGVYDFLIKANSGLDEILKKVKEKLANK